MSSQRRIRAGLAAAFLFTCVFYSGNAQAQEGSNHCEYYPPSNDMGVCGNRRLPADKIRNLRNLRLECGSGVDHYIRTFVPFHYKKWKFMEENGDHNAMQKMRLDEPAIAWGGSIPYETTEAWSWTDCVYGKDPVCGTHKECHTEQECTTDKDGKQTCHDVEVCVDVMNNCYHDENETESRYCSTERLDFNAAFAKPDKSWNPSYKFNQPGGYYDVIPNKYDLLPGEVEDVQVFANSDRGTSVTPSVDIGDAWNKYHFNISIDGHGSSASCQYNQQLHANVTVYTDTRLTNKTTPNAMRIPVNEKGEEQNPLQWLEQSGSEARYRPRQIGLMDVSHTMIGAMARQSRENDVKREEAKEEVGKSGNQTPEEYSKEKEAATLKKDKDGVETGFFKNTQVRIRLKEITGALSRDIRISHNLYKDGNDANGDGLYDLALDGGSCDNDMYRASGPFSDSLWDGYKVELKRNRKYKFLISMFQEGVPFYKQTGNVYSKELQINFKTENVDERALWQKFINWQGGW